MTETADEQEAILREGVGLKLELSREELGQKAAEEGKEQGPDDNAVALLAALQQHQEQEAEYLMRDLAVKVPLRFNFALEILLLPIKRLPPFSLIRDSGKQNTLGNVSKISVSLACY